MTHTYVTIELSRAAYDEIAAKMKEAGYDHAFNEEGEIDMHGIAVVHNGQPNALEEKYKAQLWKYGKHLTACRLSNRTETWCDCGWKKVRATLAPRR